MKDLDKIREEWVEYHREYPVLDEHDIPPIYVEEPEGMFWLVLIIVGFLAFLTVLGVFRPS